MPWREARYDAPVVQHPAGITFHRRNYVAVPSAMLLIHTGKFTRVRMFYDQDKESLAFQFCNGDSTEGAKVRKKTSIFSYRAINGIIKPKMSGSSAFVQLKESGGKWVAEI